MATMTEIAKKAGVSQATVSRVINGDQSVRLETRQKVMEWVRKLEYHPNLMAQSLVKKQSYLLGMIVPEISNPYFSEVLSVVEQEASLHGYHVIFCNSGGNIRKEKDSIKTLRSRQVDGLLIAPVIADAPHLNGLHHSKIPVVMITQEITQFDSVGISLERGAALVAKHFLELGHQKIGFIGTKTDEKFQGFSEMLQSQEAQLPDENVVELTSSWEQLSSHEIHQKFTAYLERRGSLDVTALFAYNDLAAFIVIRILQEHGYRIPDDIAVAGFDNTFLASEMRPQLTSVAQPISDIGRVAIEMLLEQISDHEKKHTEHVKILLDPHLVVRESTRKIAYTTSS